MAREIPLTKGYVAVVDDEDYTRLAALKWHAGTQDGRVYAVRRNRNAAGCQVTYMHREVLGAASGVAVDHRSGDTLDNRRLNLREATARQNLANQRKYGSRSRFKGVWPTAKSGKWTAVIRFHGRRYYCGCYRDEEDAARAYDAMARKFHGEFARLNFPGPGEQNAIGDDLRPPPWTPTPRPNTTQRDAEIIRRRGTGDTARAIALTMGLSVDVVWRVCRVAASASCPEQRAA